MKLKDLFKKQTVFEWIYINWRLVKNAVDVNMIFGDESIGSCYCFRKIKYQLVYNNWKTEILKDNDIIKTIERYLTFKEKLEILFNKN